MADHWLIIDSTNYDSHCGEEGAYPLTGALNGDNVWVHWVQEEHYFILDLGETYTIKKVHGRSNDIADPYKVDIYVSDDKGNWGAAVATDISTWKDTDVWAEINTTDKDGRYVKVVIKETGYGVNGELSFGKPAGMTIFDVYGDVAGAPPPSERFMTGRKYW